MVEISSCNKKEGGKTQIIKLFYLLIIFLLENDKIYN